MQDTELYRAILGLESPWTVARVDLDVKWQETSDPSQIQGDSRQLDPARVDVSAREQVAFGPSDSSLEDALARAIEGAVAAARWDVVSQLARELEARRLARTGDVVTLAATGASEER